MNTSLLIIWLIAILPSNSLTIKYLDNAKLDIIQHVFNVANAYEVDPEYMVSLGDCESNFSPKAKGDFSNELGIYRANGIFQWWKSSWNKYTKLYNFNGDYNNPKDQAELTAIVVSGDKKGWTNWFNCSKKIKKEGYF